MRGHSKVEAGRSANLPDASLSINPHRHFYTYYRHWMSAWSVGSVYSPLWHSVGTVTIFDCDCYFTNTNAKFSRSSVPFLALY